MSIEALTIAFHHSRATGAAKLVLLGIANHDGDGGAWPAVATLAKYAHTDRRNVQRYLLRLEQLGEIRRMIGQGGDHATADHRRPNLYRFTLRCPSTCDGSKNHRTTRDEELMLGAVIQPPAVNQPRGGAVNQPHKPSSQPSIDQERELGTVQARESEQCRNGHPIIDQSSSGVPFCALGCAPSLTLVGSDS